MDLGKRTVGLYCLIILTAMSLIFRLYYLMGSDYLTAVSQSQSSYILEAAESRGTIYDCSFRPLVNESWQDVAAVMPGREATEAIAEQVTGEKRASALGLMAGGKPFLLELDGGRIYGGGILNFRRWVRYADRQLAPHVIGYLDGEGHGIRGIEQAYDSLLSGEGSRVSVSYQATAAGTAVGDDFWVEGDDSLPAGGVVLTLDRDIQELAQNAAGKAMDRGAVVVMDVDTGDLKAAVSLPGFDPENVGEAIRREEESPLYNRAFAAANVGSTFKLVVAAAALEAGIGTDYAFYCPGEIEVDGHVFSCHNKDGHGWLDMDRAIQQSCNPYFIRLGQELEPEALLAMARLMGFGESCTLASGMQTQAGTLDTAENLEYLPNRANFCFGQGNLTASPVQLAQMVSCIANGGKRVVPSLVLGTTRDGQTLWEARREYASSQVMSPQTAAALRQFMIHVVEVGSGVKGTPEHLGAGGKTASAQTGKYEDGIERVDAWFAGFYPAENPRYAIVIYAEGGRYGGDMASPVFKEIADGIWELEYSRLDTD